MKWIDDQGYKYDPQGCREIFLNDATATPSERLLVEIQVPIVRS